MTAQQPFDDFGRWPSRVALSGIVPVALVHDVDLVARRCRFSPLIGRRGRGAGRLAHGIRLRLRRRACKGAGLYRRGRCRLRAREDVAALN